MSDNNKSYRIRTNINTNETIHLNLNLNQDYKNFEILSLNLDSESLYKMYTSEYGCIVGRVLANDALGIPNAKVSIFVKTEESDDIDPILHSLYPYENVLDKNEDNIRYNTLPDEVVNECHQSVGTFPNKRLVLDDDNMIEIYNKYYKYSTITNAAGDYMIFGVPVGEHTVHVDIDLSDVGELSIRPIDMIQKGYDVSQFESPAMFKKGTDLDNLSQIFSQNTSVMVKPFWGDDEDGQVSITRNDISIQYKFEPSCVFMGSLITDSEYVGFSKRCIPSMDQGNMSQLVGKSGVIEMIRKTPNDNVESFIIEGNQLIDGSGVWCYQIPMNLDYVGTDEYGNRVKTNDVNKGVPTRARVRFRMSLHEETSYGDLHSTKVLVPHNPKKMEEMDYSFGSDTKDNDEASLSFRDLFANNVYSVKSYIPRIQKGNGQRTKKFSGIKNITVNNGNNQIPYNNMRVNITFMFVLQCAILKILIWIITVVNKFLSTSFWYDLWGIVCSFITVKGSTIKKYMTCLTLGDVLCPDMEGWYFAPGCESVAKRRIKTIGGWLFKQIFGDHGKSVGEAEKTSMTPLERTAINKSWEDPDANDEESIDFLNSEDEGGGCVTDKLNYLMQCVEITLALEHQVIQFDFYNDWLNGTIYLPKWFGNIKRKRNYFFGLIKRPEKILACMEGSFNKTRNLVQQCALTYKEKDGAYTEVTLENGCSTPGIQKCHKRAGRKYIKVLGYNGGVVHSETTSRNDVVYYLRPFEIFDNKNVFLFATDIILLGSLHQYNRQGIPYVFDGLVSSSYKFPSLLATTNLQEDGNIFGACPNTDPIKAKVSTLSTTFKQDEDAYDGMEYMVTETSGVDWGYSGPSQGVNNLNTLYFPGGHFLGISCFNSEVNVKSCINLSRVCEIGTSFSQFFKIPTTYNINKKTSDGSEEIEYIQYQPNGLISKREITDSQYRNVFATLNSNALKTITNIEKQEKEYVFTSKLSFNFDGILSKNTSNDDYRKARKLMPMFEDKIPQDENDVVYGTAFEFNDKDYYSYRFGEYREYRDAYLGKTNDGSVFLPVYNNSFYFYFGIKYGNTSYDKLYEDYYGICENNFSTTPSLSVVSYVGNKICTQHEGYAHLKVDSLSGPYTVYFTYKAENETGYTEYQLEKFENLDNKMVITPVYENNKYLKCDAKQLGGCSIVGFYRDFYFKELLNGDYTFYINTLHDSMQYSVSFTIEQEKLEDVPELSQILSTITTEGFKNGVYEPFDRDSKNTNKGGCITIDTSPAAGSISKIYITHEEKNLFDGTTTITKICDSIKNYDENGKKLPGYIKRGTKSTNDENVYYCYVPSGDTQYYVNFEYNCPEEVPIVHLKSDYSYVVPYSKLTFDYYFTQPIMSGRILRNLLNDGKISIDSFYGNEFAGWYMNPKIEQIAYNGNNDAKNADGLSASRFAFLERSLIYKKSIFQNIEDNITHEFIDLGISTNEYDGGELFYLTGNTVNIAGKEITVENNTAINTLDKTSMADVPVLMPTTLIDSKIYYFMNVGRKRIYSAYPDSSGVYKKDTDKSTIDTGHTITYNNITYPASFCVTKDYYDGKLIFVEDIECPLDSEDKESPIILNQKYTITFFIKNTDMATIVIWVNLSKKEGEQTTQSVEISSTDKKTQKIEISGYPLKTDSYIQVQIYPRYTNGAGKYNKATFYISDIYVTSTRKVYKNYILEYTYFKKPINIQNYGYLNDKIFDYGYAYKDGEAKLLYEYDIKFNDKKGE